MAYKDGDLVDLELTVNEQLIYNTGVGDEWDNWQSIRYNGEKYYCGNGKTITIPYRLGDELEIHSYVSEQDNRPDEAWHSSYDTITAEEAQGGDTRTWSHTLNVVENNGRFPDETAQWEILFGLHMFAYRPGANTNARRFPNVYSGNRNAASEKDRTGNPIIRNGLGLASCCDCGYLYCCANYNTLDGNKNRQKGKKKVAQRKQYNRRKCSGEKRRESFLVEISGLVYFLLVFGVLW